MNQFVLIVILFPLILIGQTDLEVVKVNNTPSFKKEITERNQTYKLQKDSLNKTKREISPGNVNIILGDERINILDEYVRENPLSLNGYRVQLVFGERATINQAKAKFYSKYSSIPVYESWLSPNFRLRVGDFLTRMQAEAFKREIQEFFPGAYIVNDKINVPKFVKEDLETEH